MRTRPCINSTELTCSWDLPQEQNLGSGFTVTPHKIVFSYIPAPTKARIRLTTTIFEIVNVPVMTICLSHNFFFFFCKSGIMAVTRKWCLCIPVCLVCRLSGCQVSEDGCTFLAKALESKTTCFLKQLDLSYNHPGVNGVTTLSATAPYRNMSLEIWYVNMSGCVFICVCRYMAGFHNDNLTRYFILLASRLVNKTHRSPWFR